MSELHLLQVGNSRGLCGLQLRRDPEARASGSWRPPHKLAPKYWWQGYAQFRRRFDYTRPPDPLRRKRPCDNHLPAAIGKSAERVLSTPLWPCGQILARKNELPEPRWAAEWVSLPAEPAAQLLAARLS